MYQIKKKSMRRRNKNVKRKSRKRNSKKKDSVIAQIGGFIRSLTRQQFRISK